MLLALAIVADGSFSDPAGVAESVDAPDSKSGFRKEVGVRVPPPAPAFAREVSEGWCVEA